MMECAIGEHSLLDVLGRKAFLIASSEARAAGQDRPAPELVSWWRQELER
jgi:hypothetical protein